MTTPDSAAAWFIEWDASTLYLTHVPCNRSRRIEQGSGSPFFLDSLDRLTSSHECAVSDGT